MIRVVIDATNALRGMNLTCDVCSEPASTQLVVSGVERLVCDHHMVDLFALLVNTIARFNPRETRR